MRFYESARQEAIDTIIEMAEYKRSGSAEKLIVTGCLVEKYKDELSVGIPEADVFLGDRRV